MTLRRPLPAPGGFQPPIRNFSDVTSWPADLSNPGTSKASFSSSSSSGVAYPHDSVTRMRHGIVGVGQLRRLMIQKMQ